MNKHRWKCQCGYGTDSYAEFEHHSHCGVVLPIEQVPNCVDERMEKLKERMRQHIANSNK